MEEEWEDISDYEEYYQASNHGRVRSLDRYIIRNGSQALIKGKVLKLQKDEHGYIRTTICKNNKRKCLLVHRLVLTVFDRPPKDNEEGNHKDGNKENNYKSNLEWCTHKQNCDHRDSILDRHCRGERSGKSELTDNKVREIKGLLKEIKITQKEIAKLYNVSQGMISSIKSGKRWGYLK
jgi:hypothetical protein